jgi:hypothetical protein
MKSRDMGKVIWMQNRSIYDLFINLNYFLHTKIGQTFKHTCDQVGYIVVQMLLKFKFHRYGEA